MEELKQKAAEKACEHVKDGMILGLGTGTTVKYAIRKIGELVKGGLKVKGIPTSAETEELAKKERIPLTNFEENSRIDLTIDGADEVDPELNLIKGRGGALTREKIVAFNSKREIIVVDETKVVGVLGKAPLPVEVVPLGASPIKRELEKLGAEVSLRTKNGKEFFTDNGNYILDCKFNEIKNAKNLETKINSIPGVVENGLFINLADKAIVGTSEGIKILEGKKSLNKK
ncbi:MAG TPA: ribose-5-phosphate isomerase RpiA [Thermoplasmata archaeon]|nr:ribose-5-phosphate isomerase RpiA [Thermoplasmata archaeon]